MILTQADNGPLPALQLLQTLVARNPDQHRNVYLISDFRQNDWENPAEIKEALANLSSQSEEIHLVDCVENGNTNLAITELLPADDTRAAGVPLFMHLRVLFSMPKERFRLPNQPRYLDKLKNCRSSFLTTSSPVSPQRNVSRCSFRKPANMW